VHTEIADFNHLCQYSDVGGRRRRESYCNATLFCLRFLSAVGILGRNSSTTLLRLVAACFAIPPPPSVYCICRFALSFVSRCRSYRVFPASIEGRWNLKKYWRIIFSRGTVHYYFGDSLLAFVGSTYR